MCWEKAFVVGHSDGACCFGAACVYLSVSKFACLREKHLLVTLVSTTGFHICFLIYLGFLSAALNAVPELCHLWGIHVPSAWCQDHGVKTLDATSMQGIGQ